MRRWLWRRRVNYESISFSILTVDQKVLILPHLEEFWSNFSFWHTTYLWFYSRRRLAKLDETIDECTPWEAVWLEEYVDVDSSSGIRLFFNLLSSILGRWKVRPVLWAMTHIETHRKKIKCPPSRTHHLGLGSRNYNTSKNWAMRNLHTITTASCFAQKHQEPPKRL